MLYIGSYQDGWASWKVQECFFFPFVKYLQTFHADFHFYNHLQFAFYDACCSSCTKVRQLTGKLEPPGICWFQFHWSSRAKAVGSVATAQLCQSHSQHPPQKRNSQSCWTVRKNNKTVTLHFHIVMRSLIWFWLHPDLWSLCVLSFFLSLNDAQFHVHRFQLGGRGCQDQVPEQDGSADHIRRHAGQRLPAEEVMPALPGLLSISRFAVARRSESRLSFILKRACCSGTEGFGCKQFIFPKRWGWALTLKVGNVPFAVLRSETAQISSP